MPETDGPVTITVSAPALASLRRAEAEVIASRFHATYERLASTFHYETRRESAVPWSHVPQVNRDLMVAVVETLLAEGTISTPSDERKTP